MEIPFMSGVNAIPKQKTIFYEYISFYSIAIVVPAKYSALSTGLLYWGLFGCARFRIDLWHLLSARLMKANKLIEMEPFR